jgi:hypothetical protein
LTTPHCPSYIDYASGTQYQHQLPNTSISVPNPFKMFEGFKEFEISVAPSLTFYGLRSGSGPPLLLLQYVVRE